MTRYVSVAVVDDPAQLGEDHYCLGDLPVCVPNWFGKHHVEDYMGRTLRNRAKISYRIHRLVRGWIS